MCVDTTVIAWSQHVIQELQDRPLTLLEEVRRCHLDRYATALDTTVIAGSQHAHNFGSLAPGKFITQERETLGQEQNSFDEMFDLMLKKGGS